MASWMQSSDKQPAGSQISFFSLKNSLFRA